eukprot:TRINITY_DN1331_c0_g1_i1.p2 TRINITY_DN1331_c0_g1~~TRINITY_DN1331_c0_g1_i1.p2  ORF type:complete len:179 (+),score=94.34 TRINITY_DN1331_c0_g1_i1:55-537(+)
MLRKLVTTGLTTRSLFTAPVGIAARRMGGAHHDAPKAQEPEFVEAVQPKEVYLFDPEHPEYEEAMKAWNDLSDVPEELHETFKANVPIPIPFNLGRYIDNIKKANALKKNGVRAEDINTAWKQYNLSAGVFTLEWVLPSPPPIHTFEELPIIKEAPDFHP